MKFNNKKILFFTYLVFFVFCFPIQVQSIDKDEDLIKPNPEEGVESNIPSVINLDTIPDFIPYEKGNNASSEAAISFKNTPIKIEIETLIDIKKVKLGDDFSGRVTQDFYIPGDLPYLIIPKGSWLQGKISFVRRPNLIKKTGDLIVHLNEIITTIGSFALLNTELELKAGVISYGNSEQDQNSQISNAPVLSISTKMLELKKFSELLSGRLIASSVQETNGSLYKGQQFNIFIDKQLELVNQ